MVIDKEQNRQAQSKIRAKSHGLMKGMKGEIQNGPISNMNYMEVIGERLKRILATTYELSFQRAKTPKQHLLFIAIITLLKVL